MKYLCLICAEPATMMEHLSDTERDTHFAEYVAFTRDIARGGHFIGGNRLLPPAEAVTVRVRDGKMSDHGRPFRRDQGAARRLLPDRSEKT